MTWVPDPAPVTNQWSGFIDATTTGDWYFTGATGTATGCNLATPCTFSAAQTALAANDSPPATIYTVAVAKGRDNAWVGAVDNLRINDDDLRLRAHGGFRDQLAVDHTQYTAHLTTHEAG